MVSGEIAGLLQKSNREDFEQKVAARHSRNHSGATETAKRRNGDGATRRKTSPGHQFARRNSLSKNAFTLSLFPPLSL
jgi:hypothetical protein